MKDEEEKEEEEKKTNGCFFKIKKTTGWNKEEKGYVI